MHKRTYSYCHAERSVEIVNIRVKAVGSGKKIHMKTHPLSKTKCVPDLKKKSVFFSDKKVTAPIYGRYKLEAGNSITGPAIIADKDSTLLLPPTFHLSVDPYLNLIIREKQTR
jgi:N-methylhydantoinase A